MDKAGGIVREQESLGDAVVSDLVRQELGHGIVSYAMRYFGEQVASSAVKWCIHLLPRLAIG
eukprot:8164413-Pyramimonas_sp.AAC.1